MEAITFRPLTTAIIGVGCGLSCLFFSAGRGFEALSPSCTQELLLTHTA